MTANSGSPSMSPTTIIPPMTKKPAEPYVYSPDNIYMNQPAVAKMVWKGSSLTKNLILSTIIPLGKVKLTSKPVSTTADTAKQQKAKVTGSVADHNGVKSMLFNIDTSNGSVSFKATARATKNILNANKNGVISSILGSGNSTFSLNDPQQVAGFLNEAGIGLTNSGISITTLRSPTDLPQVTSMSIPSTSIGSYSNTLSSAMKIATPPTQTGGGFNLLSSVFDTGSKITK